MKKSNNYVGIDISKLTFDVAISSSDGKYKYFKFANNHEGFMMFLERLNDSESIWVYWTLRLTAARWPISVTSYCQCFQT